MERPAVIFLYGGNILKDAARTVILERSFEEEIFELVDMETIRQEGLWE